jgi:FkbM family methyltransferase
MVYGGECPRNQERRVEILRKQYQRAAMNHLKVLARDTSGLAAACGVLVAMRWLFCILFTLPQCLSARNLQPADLRMGDGPFAARRRGARAKLSGYRVFSGIREIWARDVYLKDDYLSISNSAVVIDLGANLGNFTNLALAQHDNVRVIAVEPSLSLSDSLRKAVASNGWSDRMAIKRAFIGISTQVQKSVVADPDYSDVPSLTEQEFLKEFDISRIDFLKCDIEGSEFFMLEPGSRILSITRNLAIEIHAWGGSVPAFLSRIDELGFEIGSLTKEPDGTCIALCRRTGT